MKTSSIYLTVSSILLLFPFLSMCKNDLKRDEKKEKMLQLFSVIRFQNCECVGLENRNGTCYLASECAELGGTSSGKCAHGFGVCCVFSLGCGAQTNQNCTYFESNANSVSTCELSVCKLNDQICQLRLDFDVFDITGPSTSIVGFAAASFNQILINGGLAREISQNGQCLTDAFSVTNPGGNSPPSICGLNTGQHLYVDASDLCNQLTFLFGESTIQVPSFASREFRIKVSQYRCDYTNLAPQGCDQFFFGSQTGVFQSYNFDGGEHLAEQDHTFCFRRERGNGRICYSQTGPDDFQTSGKNSDGGRTLQSECCAYGNDQAQPEGAGVKGFDCLEIPGAFGLGGANTVARDRFCGRALVSRDQQGEATICSCQTPFYVRFLSDRWENVDETVKTETQLIFLPPNFVTFGFVRTPLPDRGIRIFYMMSADGCA